MARSDQEEHTGWGWQVLASMAAGVIAAILFFLGIVMVGTGHGTWVFLGIVLMPMGWGIAYWEIGVSFVLWMIVGFCVGNRCRRTAEYRIVFTLLIAHYLGLMGLTLSALNNDELPAVRRVISGMPFVVGFWVFLYLLAHGTAWWSLWRSRPKDIAA